MDRATHTKLMKQTLRITKLLKHQINKLPVSLRFLVTTRSGCRFAVRLIMILRMIVRNWQWAGIAVFCF